MKNWNENQFFVFSELALLTYHSFVGPSTSWALVDCQQCLGTAWVSGLSLVKIKLTRLLFWFCRWASLLCSEMRICRRRLSKRRQRSVFGFVRVRVAKFRGDHRPVQHLVARRCRRNDDSFPIQRRGRSAFFAASTAELCTGLRAECSRADVRGSARLPRRLHCNILSIFSNHHGDDSISA